MQRCKECGIPINDGEFCCEKCEETWNRRENPQLDAVEENTENNEEEVVLETHLNIAPAVEPVLESAAEEPEEKSENTLFKAVADSDSASVKMFIDEGADINLTNEYGYTPLHEAARVGDVSSAAFLVAAGADINAVNNKGWTPLHRASNYGNLDVVKLLVEKDAQINVQESEGLTPLVVAIEREHYEIATYLVIKGCDPNGINKKGRPVLISALKKCQLKLTRALIEHGADPNSKEGNDSALLLVLKSGDLDLVELLVEKGANPNVSDSQGQSALIYAFKCDHLEIAKLFVENGADVNCKDDKGQTALHFAAKIKDVELLKLLVNKGAKAVVWNKLGLMPVHMSSEKEIKKVLNKKMFPSKIIYSLRVFFLAFLLTSVTIPTVLAYFFSVFVFLLALVFTEWPRKSSIRLYFLEIMAVYMLLTTTFGIYPEDFSYPYVFLLFPVAALLLLNFFFRPIYLFLTTVKDDGSRPGFMEFVRELFLVKISLSPITVLRTLNTLVIVVLLVLSVVYNYEHLKKNDQYLLSYALKVVPDFRKSRESDIVVKKDRVVVNTAAIKKKSKFKAPEPGKNKDYDNGIKYYLKKDFKTAVLHLTYASEDVSISGRAKELILEIKRFERLYDRVEHPEKYKTKRRGNPINRMIQYDKNISGGQLEGEILMLKHLSQ